MFYSRIDQELELKLLSAEFAPALFELTERNRTWLRQWLPWLDGIKKPEHTAFFVSACLERYATGEQMNCAVLYRNELAGVIGFHNIREHTGTCAIGYWLSEDLTGRGIITRSVREMERVAFTDMKLSRTEIRCAPTNLASRRIPERLGYRKEGLLRRQENLYGRVVDHVVYGLLKEEYRARESGYAGTGDPRV
jgi:ribosomal-protein-serine acetyltransferase